jgi:hypothetical protein
VPLFLQCTALHRRPPPLTDMRVTRFSVKGCMSLRMWWMVIWQV